MTSKLNALHWQAYHLSEEDWQVVRRINPLSVKVFDAQYTSPFFVERLFAEAPRAVICFRNHSLSEDKGELYANPAALGQRHAQHFIDLIKRHLLPIKTFQLHRAVYLGVNEPKVDVNIRENGEYRGRLPRPNFADHVATYYREFARTLHAFSRDAGAMVLNASVGWPDNHEKDSPVDYSYFDPIREVMTERDFLGLHEYFANWRGVNFTEGWWIDRLGQCPWDVPIILGETGCDNGVDWNWVQEEKPKGHGAGWQLYQSAEQYLAALRRLDDVYRADSRVHSAQVFTYDGTRDWQTFNIQPIRELFASYIQSRAAGPLPPARPFPRYPANINLPPEEEPDMSADYAPARWVGSPHFNRRPPGTVIESIILHATANSSLQGVIDWFNNPASGVSAHYTVGKDGQVVQHVRERDRAWHAGNSAYAGRMGFNDFAIGIELVNRNDGTDPYPAPQLAALVALCRYLVAKYPMKESLFLPHFAIAPERKSDPAGLDMTSVQAAVFAPSALRYDKIAWGIEEVARLLQKEGWHAEHDHLLDSEVYQDAVERR